MPWCEKGKVELRLEFVRRYRGGETLSSLCREFAVSRPTGYLWVERYGETERLESLFDRSSKPHRSPSKTERRAEQKVVSLREQYGWGARKLQVLLREREGIVLSESTIKRIFHRNNLIDIRDRHRPALNRFERTAPNELWQADFKGPMGNLRVPCEPLSILDDHSRYLIGLHAVASKRIEEVKAAFEKSFTLYGIPEALLLDHGTPWWSNKNRNGFTQLSVWFMNQDIKVIYSGFNHPQTQGKVERFHKTLDDSVSHKGTPHAFEGWKPLLTNVRREYNHIRPHESLGMDVPASRYQKSSRPYQRKIKAPEYPSDAIIKRVDRLGAVNYEGGRFFVSEALCNQFVTLTRMEDSVLVTFRKTHVRELNLHSRKSFPIPMSYSHL